MSDHNVKLAGHFQNLVGQCPMTDCYFQHCSGKHSILKSCLGVFRSGVKLGFSIPMRAWKTIFRNSIFMDTIFVRQRIGIKHCGCLERHIMFHINLLFFKLLMVNED